MLALLLLCVSDPACASGPEPPPLPVWRGVYASNIEKVPAGHTSFLSPDFSSLVFVLKDSFGNRSVKTVPLNKRVQPRVRVSFGLGDAGHYEYLYTVTNDASARDAILRFWLVIPAAFDSRFAFTDGEIGGREWNGLISFPVIAKQCEITGAARGRYAAWVGTSGDQYRIRPGQSRSGFGLKTSFRPGFTTAYVGGAFVLIPEEWDVDNRILADPVWTSVHIPVIGPIFEPGASCQDILTNYHEGLTRLLQCSVPERGKKAVSELLARIDAASSSCSELARRITTDRPWPDGVASDARNALSLALKPFLTIDTRKDSH